MKTFEMADADDPKGIVLATQRAFSTALLDIIKDLRAQINQPGLTWEQMEHLISSMGNKQPKIIVQTGEM